MLARSPIAVLLLISYLLVVGMGGVSRPDNEQELILVRTEVGGPYQECRYVRMDGLEEFLNEALASRYLNAPETLKHQLISVVPGVDAHHLPHRVCPLVTPANQVVATPSDRYACTILSGRCRTVHPPPRFR